MMAVGQGNLNSIEAHAADSNGDMQNHNGISGNYRISRESADGGFVGLQCQAQRPILGSS